MQNQEEQMLELLKELVNAIESGHTSILGIDINIDVNNIIKLTITVKDTNE